MTKKPQRRSDVIARELGSETILYNTDQEQIHVLNATAQLIWSLCDGRHSLSDIENELRQHFAIDADYDVNADIEQTLLEFAQKGLLQD